MNKQDKTELILKGSIYKALINLSIPIMINSIIQSLYNLVDGIWVSKISSVHFAATSFVWPVNFLFIAIGLGISIAGTSLLSQFIGAGKIKDGKEYSTQLFVISTILGLIFTIIGVIISPYIIKAMGAEGEFAKLANTYLRVTFFDLPFLFLFFNIESTMTAQGNTVTPTILGGIAGILNVILDPIFIFTFNMGIAGAAWATVLSRVLCALYGMKLIFSDNNKIKPDFRGFKFNNKIIKDLAKVGLPASIGQTGASIGFMFLNGFIVSYGTATMAAFGMVNRVSNLVMQPAMSVGSALTAVVGQNLGANQLDRADESFKKSSIISLTIGVIGCVILFIFNKEIVSFFIQSKDDPKVISESMTFMRYTAFSMPLMGMFSVFQGIFQGSGNTKYSMAMEVGRLWFVRLPMILIFKHLTNFGSRGIWFSMAFSNLIVCLYGYWVFKTRNWKSRQNSTIENGQFI